MNSSDSAASPRHDSHSQSPESQPVAESSQQAVLVHRADDVEAGHSGDGRHHNDNGVSVNGAHGNGSNGTNGGSPNGEGTLNVADPRTRVLLEQLLTTLSTETVPEREKSLRPPSLATYWGMIRRRWKPMFLLFVLTLGTVAWKLKPGEPFYVTGATMLLPSANAGGGGDSVRALLGGVGKDVPGGAIDTQLAIVTSPKVQTYARHLARVKLIKQGKPPASLDYASVSAAAPVSPELISITSSSTSSPESAEALANATVEAFGAYMSRQGDVVHEANLKFIGQKVKEVGAQLQSAKSDLQRYKEQNQVFSIETELARNANVIQDLENKARNARIDADAGETGTTVLADGITTGLQQKANEARLKYDTVLQDFLPSSPEARAAESDWRAAQGQVDKRISTLMRQAQQQVRDTQRELDLARASAARLPRVEYNLSQKTARVAQLQTLFQTLTDRYTALNLTRNAKSSTVTSLAQAVGASPVSGTWSRAIMTGLLCALVMALACAALLEQLDSSIHAVDDIEPLLQTPVLGAMPLLRGRAERRLAHITGAQPMAPLVLESCRIIRSNLAFATMDAPVRSILITSADAGEGKSLSALNLATVMAFDGRSVVLLDCDLRRPSQHTLNGLPLEAGFTNVLSGEASLEETLQSTSVKNLKVLTAGTLPLNPPELLGSRDTRQLLNTLKEMFDIVIIDSPPILSLTDAQVLCSVADGIAMVVAADSTPRAHVQRAQAMLRRAGGRVLGVIFNKVKKYNNPDAYGGYYGQGNTYGNNIVGTAKQLGESVGGLSKRA